MEAAPKLSWWKRRGQRLALRAIVLQIALAILFVGLLMIGERSHASFFALYLPRQPLLIVVLVAALLARAAKNRTLFAVQVVLCLVVFFPVMGARVWFAPSRPREERVIRLATYNVYFGKMGRPMLLDELAALPVDVLLLQATYDSIGDRLRERLPDRTVRQDGELVVVSRFPILEVDVPPLLPGNLKPMFVRYTLDTPAGHVRVFNVHPFSPRNALLDRDEAWNVDVAHREAQVAALAAAFRRPGPPFVVAGDTNLPHLSAIFRRELGDLTDAFEESGFGLGYTFPSKRPWMRIDRVLAGPGIAFRSLRVGDQGTSDHRPVLAEFAVAQAGAR